MSSLLYLVLDILRNVLIAAGLFSIAASAIHAINDGKYGWHLFFFGGLSITGAMGLATLLSHY